MSEYIEFADTPFVGHFADKHGQTTKKFLESFLQCKVSIVFSPAEEFESQYDADIFETPENAVYEVNATTLLIAVHPPAYYDKRVSLGLVLNEPLIALPPLTLAEIIANQMLKRLKHAMLYNFDVDLQFFGKQLILDTIVEYISRGGFNKHNIKFAIDLFTSLRTMTFENRLFNTGLIITKSHRTYRTESRKCRLIPLTDPIFLMPNLRYENRFWYLADGSSCFYVCDRNLKINSMFFFDEPPSSITSISTNFLKKSLHEQDIAFRTINGREMVIVEATGEEFTYSVGQWHFRDYNLIKKAMRTLLPAFTQAAIDALLELTWSLMASRHGSLIWIPEREEDIDQMTLRSTRLWEQDVSIDDERYHGLIHRLASSDGALILSQDSRIHRFGGIANLSTLVQGDTQITGSGELAAQFLSHSGVVIKISQDGSGSVYANHKMRWKL
ncbi:MAG: hypothetical protein HQL90_08345 [Magnetococcales bacterium]|nr:hypothetical protein [Magnetococcales bacterium]